MLSPSARQILRQVLLAGPRSRSELAERLQMRPNSVGSLVGQLIDQGLLRDGSPEKLRQGRPRVPLEIDLQRRCVVGLAIRAQHVTLARLTLRGTLLGQVRRATVPAGGDPIAAARRLLHRYRTDDALLIGVTAPGFVDARAGRILFSAAVPARRSVSLAPLVKAAGDVPVLLHNDMHALAARWLLTHSGDVSQDVLLVHFDDGLLGASALIAGTPNRGCVDSSNELGHMRFPVETDRCFCGHVGCLERIVSTGFFKRCGGRGTLADAIAATPNDPALREILTHLAAGLGNAVNFFRPHRLVLNSPLLQPGPWCDALLSGVAKSLLAELAERVRVEVWESPDGDAETAGWLALAGLYCPGWWEEFLLTPVETI